MNIGSWYISVYTLRLGSSICLGSTWLWYTAPKYHIKRQLLATCCWVTGLSALVGGRIGYGLMHSAYFLQNPTQFILLHHTGGLHGASALLGGLAGLFIWQICTQMDNTDKITPYNGDTLTFNQYLTYFTPAFLCVIAGAWWACMEIGCACGRAIGLENPGMRWLLADGPDLYHTILPRFPVQLVGMIWALVIAGTSTIRSQHLHGDVPYLMLYCLGAAVLTLFRGDTVPTIGPVRIDTLENLGIAFVLGKIQLLLTKGEA